LEYIFYIISYSFKAFNHLHKLPKSVGASLKASAGKMVRRGAEAWTQPHP